MVTGVGSTTAISIIKGIRKQNDYIAHVTGVDINKKNEIAGSTFCDSYYKIPEAGDKQYINTLLDIVKKEEIEILFPVIDIELNIISKFIKFFNELGVFVWISEPKTINICNDKYHTYNFFKDNKIKTPKTLLPNDVDKNMKRLIFPLIIKPRDGVSSRDVYKVNDLVELQRYIKIVNNSIIQEYIEGTEYTIDVLSDYNSNALSAVPRERIETRGGISYKGKIVVNNKLVDSGRNIAQLLKIRGACNIQCIINKKGDIYFIEVNPRFSGSLPLTIAAGVNGPLILMKIALKDSIEKNHLEYTPNISMARYWEEIFHS